LTFDDFYFHHNLLDGLDASGYINPTPIQAEVIPHVLDKRDVIACAQTGTGKTAAFLLPLIDNLIDHKLPDDISALIIVPTRELAVQISHHMEGLSYYTDVSSIAIFGGGDGKAFVEEKNALSRGADVVICTPGKMISHINMGYVKLSKLQCLVLDEADRMMDMGFHDDIMKIISFLPKQRQTLLFSATMPAKIKQLSQKILHDPIEINVAISKPNENIVQGAFLVYDAQKIELVKHVLAQKEFGSVIIFCSKKLNVKSLAHQLKRAKLNVAEIHSDLEQHEREDVMNKFKAKRISIVVATDILSRGIDVEDIDLVINYDIPHDGEDYIHRIGRTARGTNGSGTAYTFIAEKEQRGFKQIEELLGKEVPKLELPAHLGKGPAAYGNAPRPGDGAKTASSGDKKKFYHRKK
jgi:ATP-dependent RNA helicase RhlE